MTKVNKNKLKLLLKKRFNNGGCDTIPVIIDFKNDWGKEMVKENTKLLSSNDIDFLIENFDNIAVPWYTGINCFTIGPLKTYSLGNSVYSLKSIYDDFDDEYDTIQYKKEAKIYTWIAIIVIPIEILLLFLY